MNRNELEQWMKQSLDKKEFLPGEAGWNKLQEAINPPPKKKLILPFAVSLKIAAAVALLVMAGSLVYFLQDGNKKEAAEVHPHSGANAITINQTAGSASARPVDTLRPINNKTFSGRINSPLTTHDTPPVIALSNSLAPIADSISSGLSNDKTQKPAVEIPAKKNFNNASNVAAFWQEDNTQKLHPLNFGVAAQVGKASVGNMQYQIGVVAHKNISGKFYAEATLALASTDVSYNQTSKFQSVSMNAGTSASYEEKSIDAQYGKNIISLGISPNIGYRLTPRIAVSGGVSLYRNLNQSLTLKNEETIDAAAISNQVIAETKPITQWDAGLMGSANYQVNEQFALHIQYRYGLSGYMHFGNEAIRNSGLNVGLKYLFGKH